VLADLVGDVVCAGGKDVDWYMTGDCRWRGLVPGVRMSLPGPEEEKEEEHTDEEFDEPDEEVEHEEFDEPKGR
jgi:hypothetical protein